jgi:peptidoglycan/xylan/chitin deacetylase (PgdA/CDA1 family)
LTVAGAAASSGLAFAAFSLRFNWWRKTRTGTPILMYHQVGAHRPGSPLNKWRVREADFERQMRHLSRKSFTGISLRQLLECPAADPAKRRAVITFDDGFEGVLTRALPRLLERGFAATVFVVSDRLGGVNDWDAERPGEPLLTEDGVRELARAGIEIGSHGATHRALPGLSDDELARETRGSRERLESLIGAPVVSFCYPYGAFDDRTVRAVADAGYRAATVIRSGISPDLADPYRLRRVVVRGTDTALDFRLALTRGRSKL